MTIECYFISRVSRREIEEEVIAIEHTAFMFIKSSISWLGTTISPLCAFYSSGLYQQLLNCRVK